MRTVKRGQLGAVSDVQVVVRVSIAAGGIIIIMSHRRKLP